MSKFFHRLEIWEDPSPREPAGHMACDEALLLSCSVPSLRAYQWRDPAVTFGYAQKLGAIEPLVCRLPLMRRWSGGGMVFHGSDLTLALAIPAANTISMGSSREIYRSIHEGLLPAIQTHLPNARLVFPAECRCGPVCFESPVAFDIVANDLKICGGALRRSRNGVLYQGSLHLPGANARELARSLAAEVGLFKNDIIFETMVEKLVTTKYGTRHWLAMR